MNLSTLITRIKMKLGIYTIALPIDNVDGFIEDIIKDITLPVFSQYNPYTERMHINLKNLKRIDRDTTYETFLLPEFNERKLLYVKNVEYDDRSLSAIGLWDGTTPYACGSLVNQMMISNAASKLSTLTIPKLTFEFMPPRTIRLYNAYTSYNVVMDLAFQHDKSLQSIPPMAEESFFKLALLDVKDNLYPTVKHYNEIESAYGRIELKIDDWANAESERNDLIIQWDESYHLDLAKIYYS